MNEPIMIFHITLDPKETNTLKASSGEACVIPFGGHVESPMFSGTVLPGAADIQTVNAAGVRHMCAKYMFDGTDSEGNACKLFVENNAYTPRDYFKMPFDATPTFLTDSPVLAPYLHGVHFRAEGHPSPEGVDIWIFDTDKD